MKTDKNPKVSIISITYNQEKFVSEMLESLVSQKTNFMFEIIIGDDASTDGTQKIILNYAKKFPELVRPVLRKKNIGVQNNLLDVLCLARGQYIAVCEGDDFWIDSNKLQSQVDFLDLNKDFSLVFHKTRIFYDDNSKQSFISPKEIFTKEVKTEILLNNNIINTSSVMYRRVDYKSLPSNIMPYDWYLHLLHAHTGKIGYIPRVMSAYRIHKGGIWWESNQDIKKIWNKYGIGHLYLYLNTLEMFKSYNYRKITISNIDRLFDDLPLNINKEAISILTDFYETHKDIYEIKLLQKQYLKLYNITIENEEQQKIIEHVTNNNKQLELEIAHTRELCEALSQEINTIKSSRLWKLRTKIKGK